MNSPQLINFGSRNEGNLSVIQNSAQKIRNENEYGTNELIGIWGIPQIEYYYLIAIAH